MSGQSCGQEMCRNWAGDGCACRVLDIEPDIAEDFEPMDAYDEGWEGP